MQFATVPTTPNYACLVRTPLLEEVPCLALVGIWGGDLPSGTWQPLSHEKLCITSGSHLQAAAGQGETPGSQPPPGSPSLFLSQLQRFKRSLSLKTILRSKSVENFLFRSGSELKCPTEVLLTPPTPLPPPTPPPASADRGLPTPAPSPCPVPRPLATLRPVRLHSFQEHVFKRASPCELCRQLIVGRCLGGNRRGQGGCGEWAHGTDCLMSRLQLFMAPVLTAPLPVGGHAAPWRWVGSQDLLTTQASGSAPP